MSHLSSSPGSSVAFCLSFIINQPLSEASGGGSWLQCDTPPFSPPTTEKQPKRSLSTPLFSPPFMSTHPLMSLHPLFSPSKSSPVGAYLLFGRINDIFYGGLLCLAACDLFLEAKSSTNARLSATPSGEPGFISISDRLWGEKLPAPAQHCW